MCSGGLPVSFRAASRSPPRSRPGRRRLDPRGPSAPPGAGASPIANAWAPPVPAALRGRGRERFDAALGQLVACGDQHRRPIGAAISTAAAIAPAKSPSSTNVTAAGRCSAVGRRGRPPARLRPRWRPDRSRRPGSCCWSRRPDSRARRLDSGGGASRRSAGRRRPAARRRRLGLVAAAAEDRGDDEDDSEERPPRRSASAATAPAGAAAPLRRLGRLRRPRRRWLRGPSRPLPAPPR